MKIYGDIESSTVDGPGIRAIIHTAGCQVNCHGCFSTHTHGAAGVNVSELSITQIVDKAKEISTTNVTISGGEPTDQMEDLLFLLILLRSAGYTSIILYSGRTVKHIAELFPVEWNQIVEKNLVDILVDGPYKRSLPERTMMRGSTNQQFVFLTDKHTTSDVINHKVSVKIKPSGEIILLGFPGNRLLDAIEV